MFEKEAEEYTNKLLEDWELYDPEALQEAYIAGAEPREKRIVELKAQIENLVFLHKEDINTIRLLNKQIEKMKCCQNCFYGKEDKCFFDEEPFSLPNCKYCQNWKEIKEK